MKLGSCSEHRRDLPAWMPHPRELCPLAARPCSPWSLEKPQLGPSSTPTPSHCCQSSPPHTPPPTWPGARTFHDSELGLFLLCFQTCRSRCHPTAAQLPPAMIAPWPQGAPSPAPTSTLGYREHLPISSALHLWVFACAVPSECNALPPVHLMGDVVLKGEGPLMPPPPHCLPLAVLGG